jgi:hypothetical protein
MDDALLRMDAGMELFVSGADAWGKMKWSSLQSLSRLQIEPSCCLLLSLERNRSRNHSKLLLLKPSSSNN